MVHTNKVVFKEIQNPCIHIYQHDDGFDKGQNIGQHTFFGCVESRRGNSCDGIKPVSYTHLRTPLRTPALSKIRAITGSLRRSCASQPAAA